MGWRMRALVVAVVWAAAAAPATAATIWHEATDGDLGVLFENAPELNFTLGINRVIGESHLLATPEGWSDWDNDEFYFTLPKRGRWQAVTFRFTVLEAPSAAMFLHTTYSIYDTVPRFSRYPVFEFSSWMINSQNPSMVIDPLRFRGLDFTSPRYVWLDQGILGTYGSRWAYQIDFLVTQAPEPGTFALLGLGLAGLGLSRRRGAD